MSGPTDPSSEGTPSVSVSGPERLVLVALRASGVEPLDEEEVVAQTGLPADQVRGSLQRLRSKHLAVVEEEHLASRRLTPRGTIALQSGLPERRFLEALVRCAGTMTSEQAGAEGISEEEQSAAVGILRRRKALADGFPFRLRERTEGTPSLLPEEIVLKQVANGEEDVDEAILAALERRGLVRTERLSVKRWSASEEGRRLPLAAEGEDLVGSLTVASLGSGAWKGRDFRAYDVRTAVPFVRAPHENPYLAWLEEFADLLVGLGFEETEGPLLESEFWNNDVLFMPQDHPARSIHDAFWPEGVRGIPPS